MTINPIQGRLFSTEHQSADEDFGILCDLLGIPTGERWADRFGSALRKWAAKTIQTPIRTLSLFSGVGGLDIGFHDAGFSISHAVEIEPRFANTLKANSTPGKYLGGTEVVCQDVCLFHPPFDMKVDFIIGGPPCQSFSAAGRRAAGVTGTQDERGGLFREYARLLKTLRPRGFLFENVYGIAGAEGGKAWNEIQHAFAEAGYTISSRILDAADYGVPQHRERMFIVGARDRWFQFPRPTHGPDSIGSRTAISASEAISGCYVTESEIGATVGGRFGHLLNEIPAGLNYSFFTEEMNHPKPIFAWRSKFSDFLYKADPLTPVRTLKAQGGQYTGPFHWDGRPFGLAELKRLQTIPDAYEIIGKRQIAIHQIGNSVPPQLARVLALSILSQIFDVKLPCSLSYLRKEERLGFRTRKRGLTAVYRAKAKAALNGGGTVHKAAVSKSRYRAVLGSDFSWVIEDGGGELLVECAIGNSKWDIAVVQENKKAPVKPAFEIAIRSNVARPWALGGKTVHLKGFSQSREVFVGIWKAFESELVRSGMKADLVQLSEYYQYQPRFRSSMMISNAGDEKWRVLGAVTEGIGTREILEETRLARDWEVHPERLLDLAIWLRSFGFEIRNHRTNPQIPNGSYLVPYAFPTLTPFSVQLRKGMGADHAN